MPQIVSPSVSRRARCSSRLARRSGVGAAVSAVVLAATTVVVGMTPAAAVADGSAGIDAPKVNTDRRAVARRFHAAWGEPITRGREADTASCDPGTTSADQRSHTLRAVNFARSLVGETPTVFDPSLNAKATQAALVMSANGRLDHTIDPSWTCWSPTAQEAAQSSSLTFGTGPGAIQTLLDDGAWNTEAGHRRSILCAPGTVMGDGEAGSALALWHGSASEGYASPRWAAWPSAGYFPIDLEPNGRWSLGVPSGGSDTDFTSARVRVTGPDGHALKVHRLTANRTYCGATLVWDLPALYSFAGVHQAVGMGTRDYHVTVSGIIRNGRTTTVSYGVRLFDGFRRQTVRKPRLSGTAVVGRVLRVSSPVTEPTTTHVRFAWYRDSTRIPGVTSRSYRVRAADAGSRITVRITAVGGRWYWDALYRVRSATVRR